VKIDRQTSVDLGKAEGLEGIDELTELADVGEGLCMPRPHQGFAAFGLEKVDLLRVGGNAPPVLQMQQDAVFEGNRRQFTPSGRFSGQAGPEAAERSVQRLSGDFGCSARSLLGPSNSMGATLEERPSCSATGLL